LWSSSLIWSQASIKPWLLGIANTRSESGMSSNTWGEWVTVELKTAWRIYEERGTDALGKFDQWLATIDVGPSTYIDIQINESKITSKGKELK
jgi:hypothetical protein